MSSEFIILKYSLNKKQYIRIYCKDDNGIFIEVDNNNKKNLSTIILDIDLNKIDKKNETLENSDKYINLYDNDYVDINGYKILLDNNNNSGYKNLLGDNNYYFYNLQLKSYNINDNDSIEVILKKVDDYIIEKINKNKNIYIEKNIDHEKIKKNLLQLLFLMKNEYSEEISESLNKKIEKISKPSFMGLGFGGKPKTKNQKPKTKNQKPQNPQKENPKKKTQKRKR